MSDSNAAFLEIVELANGDIALRRPDDKTDPLVSIHFSEESKHFLGDIRQLVAKAMIEAGIQAVQEMRQDGWDGDLSDELDEEIAEMENLTPPSNKHQLH
jgi:hypothetical protein